MKKKKVIKTINIRIRGSERIIASKSEKSKRLPIVAVKRLKSWETVELSSSAKPLTRLAARSKIKLAINIGNEILKSKGNLFLRFFILNILVLTMIIYKIKVFRIF